MTEVQLTKHHLDTIEHYCAKARQACAGCSISIGCSEALTRYLTDGIPPGRFVSYVLQNNLVGAARNADRGNAALLALWVEVLMESFPGSAWGSVEAFGSWINEGGLKGKYLTELKDRAKRGIS